jgi:hypothetical protein
LRPAGYVRVSKVKFAGFPALQQEFGEDGDDVKFRLLIIHTGNTLVELSWIGDLDSAQAKAFFESFGKKDTNVAENTVPATPRPKPETRPVPTPQPGPVPSPAPESKPKTATVEGVLAADSLKVGAGEGFLELAVGTDTHSSEGGKWLEVPAELAKLKFFKNQSGMQGALEFTVAADGPVAVAVNSKFGGGGGGDWKKNAVTLAQMHQQGWADTGLKLKSSRSNYEIEWIVLVRDCKAGEKFKLQTEKYMPPFVLAK